MAPHKLQETGVVGMRQPLFYSLLSPVSSNVLQGQHFMLLNLIHSITLYNFCSHTPLWRRETEAYRFKHLLEIT